MFSSCLVFLCEIKGEEHFVSRVTQGFTVGTISSDGSYHDGLCSWGMFLKVPGNLTSL